MKWVERSIEEKNLLNPAFCSLLLFSAVLGAFKQKDKCRHHFTVIELFLVLPMVLSKECRESLPKSTATSMPVWKERSSYTTYVFPERARLYVSYTKEALVFGSSQGLFEIDGMDIKPNLNKVGLLREMQKSTSEEVKVCKKKAEFLGKWFVHTGKPETVFALLGVKP